MNAGCRFAASAAIVAGALTLASSLAAQPAGASTPADPAQAPPPPAGAPPAPPEAPTSLLGAASQALSAAAERWLYNARERTGAGLSAWQEQAPEKALPTFESALRLAPAEPRAQYNAGTARLAAGAPDAAGPLEVAARIAPPELQPAALYNLGNARLAAGDAAGAIEAYQQTLRLDAAQPDAKHNLELALRALAKQQEEQKKQQQQQKGPQKPGQQQQQKDQQQGSQPQDQNPEDQDPGQQPGGEKQRPPQDPGQEPQPEPAGDDPSGMQDRRDAPQPQPGQGAEQKQRLPQFREQQDMSAEQAAAILAAVENLEREQRRNEALRRVAARAKTEIDW